MRDNKEIPSGYPSVRGKKHSNKEIPSGYPSMRGKNAQL
jgi:hypothetical protein